MVNKTFALKASQDNTSKKIRRPSTVNIIGRYRLSITSTVNFQRYKRGKTGPHKNLARNCQKSQMVDESRSKSITRQIDLGTRSQHCTHIALRSQRNGPGSRVGSHGTSSGMFFRLEAALHINQKELLAVIYSIMFFAQHLSPGQHLTQ